MTTRTITLSASSRIFVIVTCTLFDRLSFFFAEKCRRKISPGYSPYNICRGTTLAAPSERLPAYRAYPSQNRAPLVSDLKKIRSSGSCRGPRNVYLSGSNNLGRPKGVCSLVVPRRDSRGSSAAPPRVSSSKVRRRRSPPRNFEKKMDVRGPMLAE